MYVFDCEVFKYDWLFVFKKVGTDNYDVIINDTNKLNEFYENNKDKLFIGFNNRAYDNLIFKGILSGIEPIRISRMVIEGKQPYLIQKSLGIKSYKLNSMDLIQDILGMSLKEAEGYMCMSIEESSVDFNLDRQ